MTRLGVDLLVPGLFSIERVPDADEPLTTASWPQPFVGEDLDDDEAIWLEGGIGAAELHTHAGSAAA